MKNEISFLGFKFPFLKFVLFFAGWMFFLGFIWPLLIGSYFGMSIFVCGFSVIFVGLFNRLIALLLFLLHHLSKSIVRFYQNFMLVAVSVFATWIYSFFVPMNSYKFPAHLVINTFSVFLIYAVAFNRNSGKIEDEMGILELEDD